MAGMALIVARWECLCRQMCKHASQRPFNSKKITNKHTSQQIDIHKQADGQIEPRMSKRRIGKVNTL